MSEWDYDITIPAECIGRFRELLRAGMDALGPGEEALVELGRDILRQIA